MIWTEKQRNEIIDHAMDLATNVDRFRQVIILTVEHEGGFNVVERMTDDATLMETLGAYRLMARDIERKMFDRWREENHPMREDDE